ncbi:hypothetical protein ACFL5K_02200 [Gemmatimonadota bacterium]
MSSVDGSYLGLNSREGGAPPPLLVVSHGGPAARDELTCPQKLIRF